MLGENGLIFFQKMGNLMKQSTMLYFYSLLSSLLPPTRFYGLKRFILNLSRIHIGKDVRCVSSARFNLTGRLTIGNGTYIGHRVLIVGGDAEVVIGKNVDIAPNVLIVSGSHEITPYSDRVAGAGYSAPIFIGNGCWLGAGSVILGASRLGENTIVAAGAVVKGDFPSRVIIGGVPAKIIKYL